MGKGRRAQTMHISLLPSPHHGSWSYLLPPVDRIMKHGVEAVDRIMKHGVVVNEARSNVQSIRTTMGLKAGDHEL
jgi:hypothetical protein